MSRHFAITAAGLLALLALLGGARAGGPASVAGVTFFQDGLAGTPITWRDGSVAYYTDQGALSPLLSQSDANALVADAFARWTAVPTAAVAAQRAGQLDEDVNGSNVTYSGGALLMPLDIEETATSKPVAVVYDADGQVTDALLGAGAGSADLCASNAAYGGPDNFYSDAHFAHALVVVNGNCARTAGDLPLLRYLLVRALGRVLGLDWSQLNDNVVTRAPAPTADDWAGFPLMHPVEPGCAGPVINCLPDPEQPRLDDRAALSRLYPVTAESLSRFPGKTAGSATTARIHGRVRFALPSGSPGQDMQGVNVVARWIDPATGQPSRRVAAASVSGFLFRGDAGNPATGFADSHGRRYDRFGSVQPEVEGYFDLAGLEIPAGHATADYQLSVEAIDPAYTGSVSVGPYRENAVAPSGSAGPLVVAGLAPGAEVERDILMTGSATECIDRFEPHTWATPTPVPAVGEWLAAFCGYGDPEYHSLAVQAGRTLALEVTALGQGLDPSTAKAAPVLGLWYASDAQGSPPRASAGYFNTSQPGMTRLDAPLGAATTVRLGLFDSRGDGRPDFRYWARVLYADSVTPARAGVAGHDPVRIRGMGFRVGTTVEIAGVPAPLLSIAPNEVLVSTPALSDGAQTIVVRDPETGATSQMTGALIYGAGAGDSIAFLTTNGNTPVGGMAANPVRVRVTLSDGVTPIPGATVTLSATPPGSIFSACGDASCRLVSDGMGEVSSLLTVKSAGTITLRATLASGAYATSTLTGTTSPLAISALSSSAYAATNATVTWPLAVRVLGSNGVPLSNRQVHYTRTQGSGTPAPAIVATNTAGEATSTLTVASLSARTQVAACVLPAENPCAFFVLLPVANSSLQVQKIAGDGQMVSVGQSFQPLTVRVTDSSSPANPVRRAALRFEVNAMRWEPPPPPLPPGDNSVGRPVRRIPVAGWTVNVVSDDNGVATLPVVFSASQGAVEVSVHAVAGSGETWFTLQALWPPPQEQ